MCSQNAGKDRKGSANVTSGASVPLNLYMLMCILLSRNCLSGLPFYELGMADGILSQTLSHCANMVTIGCDVDSNVLLRYNSMYDKYLTDKTWANKIFPVCCEGDFEMARSFSGAVCVYAWVEGGTKLLTSNILDVFNRDKQAKILVMN